MELRHLRYFVIVAEEQNITRAAERLHVSQPPLSRQIRDLEGELGVELFHRTAKSVALTEAGKVFLAEARAVLLRAENAVQAVRTVAAGEKGQLRIGYAPSLTVQLLPPALRIFEAENAGVRVSLHDLSSEECVQRLVAGKLDVALTVRPSGARLNGLSFEKITSYETCIIVAATHPLARKRSIQLEQLKEERFIMFAKDEYPEYHESMGKLFESASFRPLFEQECDSVSSLVAAVVAGRGVALAATSIKCMVGPQIRLLPLRPTLAPIVVGALTPKTPPRWVERFIGAVQQAAKR